MPRSNPIPTSLQAHMTCRKLSDMASERFELRSQGLESNVYLYPLLLRYSRNTREGDLSVLCLCRFRDEAMRRWSFQTRSRRQRHHMHRRRSAIKDFHHPSCRTNSLHQAKRGGVYQHHLTRHIQSRTSRYTATLNVPAPFPSRESIVSSNIATVENYCRELCRKPE